MVRFLHTTIFLKEFHYSNLNCTPLDNVKKYLRNLKKNVYLSNTKIKKTKLFIASQ